MPLSRSYTPPTDEQLQRFVEVMLAADAKRMGVGPIDARFGARMVMDEPVLKKQWLSRHRQLQEAAWAA